MTGTTRRGSRTRVQVARPQPQTTTAVATPQTKTKKEEPKRSKVEIIKENSDFLRHPLIEELATEASFISEDAAQLYKFHGGYQQDDREKRSFGAGKFYQFMMRTKQPAGTVPNKVRPFPITTFRLPDCPYSYQKGLFPLTVCPYIAIYSYQKGRLPSDCLSIHRDIQD